MAPVKRVGILAAAFGIGAGIMAAVLAWKGGEKEPAKAAEPPERKTTVPEEPRRVHRRTGDAAALVEEARRELAKGEVVEADELLARAGGLDGELDLVPLVRGQVAMARSDFAAALRHFDAALKLQESIEARAGRADALFQLGRFAGAVEDATKADALFTRAAAHAALGHDELALADYAAWTERHPGDAAAWVNRGNHEMRMKLRGRAIASWERAIEVDPSMKARVGALIEAARE
jgi:tetratricopeptide (TPR) repeat protein